MTDKWCRRCETCKFMEKKENELRVCHSPIYPNGVIEGNEFLCACYIPMKPVESVDNLGGKRND